MKLYKNLIVLSISLIFIFTACEDRTDLTAPEAPSTGNADFSKFFSLGNSLTQGEQSGSVYESAQAYSFTNLIARQAQADFVYPIFPDPGSGGRIEVVSLDPFSTTMNAQATTPTNLQYAGVYNNLGIKGAFLWDVFNATTATDCYTATQLTAYGVSVPNPMFDAVLRGQGTMLQQVISQNPSLVTLWIGNNDVLAYATRGGLFPPTQPAQFQEWYGTILNQLSSAGIEVVLANIPNVTSVPYFNTVGPQLIAQGVTAVVGTKSDGTIAPMDLTKNLLCLTALEELAAGKGLSAENPLSNGVILDEGEIANATALVNDGYNQIISALAANFGYAVVDINGVFSNVATNGLMVDGMQFSTQYIFGGLFSLDGVHPSNYGYALVANEFIKVINDKYNASIPLINYGELPASLPLSGGSQAAKIGIDSFSNETFNRILF